jgi:glycine dehydrogenase
MSMCFALTKGKRSKFFVDSNVHPQTKALVYTRAEAAGIEVVEGDVLGAGESAFESGLGGSDAASFAGVLIQYPDTTGAVKGFDEVVAKVHAAGALVVAATDLLALTQLAPPGEWGADIAVGSAQRFGVPMGFGGPVRRRQTETETQTQTTTTTNGSCIIETRKGDVKEREREGWWLV